MIIIINKEIISTKPISDIVSEIQGKTLKSFRSLDFVSAVNMTENDKDFYGRIANNKLSLSRIRRLSVLILLPKLIVVIPLNDGCKKYQIRLGLLTMFVALILGIALLSNAYELIDTHQFSSDFSAVLTCNVVFLGLLWIEVEMYNHKLRKYFSKGITPSDKSN